MKITKRQLRKIIKEERKKLMEQPDIPDVMGAIGHGKFQKRSELPGPPAAEELTGMEIQPSIDAIEKILNDLADDGLTNADLIKLLEDIIIDINEGFVGEPT